MAAEDKILHPYTQGKFKVNPDDNSIWNPIDRSDEPSFGSNLLDWGKKGWNFLTNTPKQNMALYNQNEGEVVDDSVVPNPADDGGGGGGGAPGAFDSANFNVQDKNQVMELQKQLFPDDPSQWDGVFGPNTEGAYRNMVNQQRTGAGQDPYTYGGPPVNDEQGGLLQTQGVNTQFQRPSNVPIGVDTSQTPFERNQAARSNSGASVGGGGFMDKFGTGEGWLSQGAERRAARKLNRQDQYGAAPHNPEFDNIDIDRNTY